MSGTDKENHNYSPKLIGQTAIDSVNRIADMARDSFLLSLGDIQDTIKNSYKSILAVTDFSKEYEAMLSSLTSVFDMTSMIKNVMVFDADYVRKSMGDLLESISSMQMEQLKQIANIDYSNILNSLYSNLDSFSDIASAAYQSMQEELPEEKETDGECLSEEEAFEVLEEQINNPESVHEKMYNWSEEKKRKYYIFFIIFGFFCNIFLIPYLQDNIGKPVMAKVVSCIRDLPQKGAEVIGHLEKNIEAVIVENTNYYYKVSYTDENGEEREGYVAKRNLKIIEDAEEDEESVSENDE